MSISDHFFGSVIDTFLGKKCELHNECVYVSPDQTTKTLSRENLPEKPCGAIRLIIVSDTHGRHDFIGSLPPGDIFVHCGDILMVGRLFSRGNQLEKLREFNEWLLSVPCTHKVVIAGNHDMVVEDLGREGVAELLSNSVYLENSSFEYNGLTFWGCPYSEAKPNSNNRAFQDPQLLERVVSKLPKEQVDVLITHGHCWMLEDLLCPSVHLWGHNHRSYGVRKRGESIRNKAVKALSVCAPIMGGSFRLQNPPVVLDLMPGELRQPYPIQREFTDSTSLAPEKYQSNSSVERSGRSGGMWLSSLFGHGGGRIFKRNSVCPDNIPSESMSTQSYISYHKR